MTQLFSNNAKTVLAAGIDAAVTTMTVATGEGDLFTSPTIAGDHQLITILENDVYEIVKMTGRTGDVLTIERAYESTVAIPFTIAAEVFGAITAIAMATVAAGIADNLGRNITNALDILDRLTVDNGGDGKGADSLTIQPSRATSNQVATGDEAIAIGVDSRASLLRAIALGSLAFASGNQSTAVGYSAKASGTQAISLGANADAVGNSDIAVGPFATATSGSLGSALAAGSTARALAIGAIALGANGGAYDVEFGIHANALPAYHRGFAWYVGTEYQFHTSLSGMLMSNTIDLAGGSTWQANTAYYHGTVVKPSTPNGFQYLWYDYYFDYPSAPYTPSLNSASEPVWPTTLGASVADGDNGEWVAIPHDGTYILALPTNMVVEEILFICHRSSGVTVQPSISIGTTGDLTKIINNQPTVGLTGDNTVTKWQLSHPIMVPDITIKIDTLAVGAELLGHFAFKGFYDKHVGV